MVLGILLFAAVLIGGIYVFVPQARASISAAWTTARDDLNKIKTDAEALVTRIENHGAAQQAAATNLAAAASTAQANANAATTTAAALKTTVASIPAAATPAAK